MPTRHQNHGVRKICGCARGKWPKCPHPWYFNFKPKGGPAYRFSLDVETGTRITSKGKAEEAADNIRAAIRAGTFRRRGDVPAVTETPAPAALTLAAFGTIYFERCGKPVSANDRGCLARLKAFAIDGQTLGDVPIDAITTDVLEVFFGKLREDRRAASTRNKYVQLVKALFRWAVKKGYLARDPVADADTIKRERHAKRTRRLVPDVVDEKGKVIRDGEERRLLAVAAPHLQRLIIGAIETGMRRGELLGLTWADVNITKKEIAVRAETTKTKRARTLPISSRLAGVLEMAKTAIEAFLVGEKAATLSEDERARLVARSYVFGDGAGLKVGNIKRAWETAVLRAHGHNPAWAEHNRLSAAARAAVRAVDLHFHDLRHEAGSRLLEAGWPLHHVQEMLGHANVSQTSTYLNATRIGLQESMRRFTDVQPLDLATSRQSGGTVEGENRENRPQSTVN